MLVCVYMTTITDNAILDKEVVVSLSSVDGTGILSDSIFIIKTQCFLLMQQLLVMETFLR